MRVEAPRAGELRKNSAAVDNTLRGISVRWDQSLLNGKTAGQGGLSGGNRGRSGLKLRPNPLPRLGEGITPGRTEGPRLTTAPTHGDFSLLDGGSSRRRSPAARWVAPSTPPPPSRDVLAALTMAATRCVVTSSSTTSILSDVYFCHRALPC